MDALLAEMKLRCDEADAQLVVVILHAGLPALKQRYADMAARHGIAVIDADVPLSSELRVPGDGHPNGEVHRRWAEILAPHLLTMLGKKSDMADPTHEE